MQTTKNSILELDAKLALDADFKTYLQYEFLNRCKKNQRYNLSAFAKFLKTDSSTLGKILKGQRPLKAAAIKRLGNLLGLNPVLIEDFIKNSPRANAVNRQIDEIDQSYKLLTIDVFQVMSDWYHYAILELIQLPSFKPNIFWVAKKLGISQTVAQLAVDRLIRLEMLQISEENLWKDLTGGKSTTLGKGYTANALKKMQRQILEKAMVALDEVAIEKRSQTSMTMAIDTNKIPEAKKLIIDFQRNLNKMLGEDRTKINSVYQFSISLWTAVKIVESF